MSTKKKLSAEQSKELLEALKKRFAKNMQRHKGMDWEKIEARLKAKPAKLLVLDEMELTEGEPDVIGLDKKTGEYIFCDCSAESPKGRRSLCYDRAALNARKEHKPKNSAVDMAMEMGIEILDETQYFELQKLGPFDAKTSSWLNTPQAIRSLGGAISAEFRFGRAFVYPNGAESYFGSRGFRGLVRV